MENAITIIMELLWLEFNEDLEISFQLIAKKIKAMNKELTDKDNLIKLLAEKKIQAIVDNAMGTLPEEETV